MKPKFYQHFIDKNPNNYIDKTRSNPIFGGIPANLSIWQKRPDARNFCANVFEQKNTHLGSYIIIEGIIKIIWFLVFMWVDVDVGQFYLPIGTPSWLLVCCFLFLANSHLAHLVSRLSVSGRRVAIWIPFATPWWQRHPWRRWTSDVLSEWPPATTLICCKMIHILIRTSQRLVMTSVMIDWRMLMFFFSVLFCGLAEGFVIVCLSSCFIHVEHTGMNLSGQRFLQSSQE